MSLALLHWSCNILYRDYIFKGHRENKKKLFAQSYVYHLRLEAYVRDGEFPKNYSNAIHARTMVYRQIISYIYITHTHMCVNTIHHCANIQCMCLALDVRCVCGCSFVLWSHYICIYPRIGLFVPFLFCFPVCWTNTIINNQFTVVRIWIVYSKTVIVMIMYACGMCRNFSTRREHLFPVYKLLSLTEWTSKQFLLSTRVMVGWCLWFLQIYGDDSNRTSHCLPVICILFNFFIRKTNNNRALNKEESIHIHKNNKTCPQLRVVMVLLKFHIFSLSTGRNSDDLHVWNGCNCWFRLSN